MTSTPTTRLRLDKQALGDNPNAWGNNVNAVFDLVDEAVSGFAEIAVNGNVTLSVNNYASDQARRAILRFTGTGGFSVTIPAVEKMYYIDNQCASAVTLKTASTAGSSVLAGTKRIAYCDGANVTTDTSATAPSAAGVAFNATPSVLSTNVQAALAEVGARTPVKRNRIVNAGMRISQEKGSAAFTQANSTNSYVLDQWYINNTSGVGVTVQQITAVTPGGSLNRLQITVPSPSGALSGSSVLFIGQRVEGLDIADMFFGTGSARAVTLRIGLRAPAGNYALSIRNSGNTRSYIAPIVVSALEGNTDIARSVVIPGDTAGSWVGDTGLGFNVALTLASGVSNTTAPAGWISGNFVSQPSVNASLVAGSVYQLFDVGLYEGAIEPPFELSSYDIDRQKCQRYYAQVRGVSRAYAASNTASISTPIYFPQPMRVTPTALIISGGLRSNVANVTATAYDGTAARHDVFALAAGDVYSVGDLIEYNARL